MSEGTKAAKGAPFSDITAISWIDSHLEVYQVSSDDLPTPCLIHSVGYIAAETAEYLTLARERIGSEWRGVVSIPKECIRERARVEVGGDENESQS